MILKQSKIPDELFNKLKKIIKDKKKEHQQELAGNIEEEYNLFQYTDVLEDFLINSIISDEKLVYSMNRQYTCNTESRPLKLTELWVNYMKKHEFNPIHYHSGVFSFIIFIKIPYTIEEQRKISPGKKSNNNLAGFLQFSFINSLGFIEQHNIPADKTWEQKILIFPSSLFHSVYPFYNTDKYRITVSGNLKFKI